MHIIILGVGQTGYSLAASLVSEHSITLVDENELALEQLQAQYDLRTIVGHGSHPRVLQEAGADQAQMLIASTNSDESNILACWVAETVFKIPIKIARIHSSDYFLENGQFFSQQSPVDYFINPANLITHTISHLIEYQGAQRIFDFGGEQYKLIATKPSINSPLLGQKPLDLQRLTPKLLAKIVAIYRRNQVMPLESSDIEIDDDILFVAHKENVSAVLNTIRPNESHSQKNKRIMIVGGGSIGESLAKNLESQHQVKLIEQNYSQCEILGRRLKNTLVLQGNGCDSVLLQNEEVENIDCFCALTNNDADNIVGSLYSKKLKAKQVIALINREAYLNLIYSGYIHIDIAISPQQITTSAILKHLRHAQIIQAYSLRQGIAEALEIVINNHSPAAGRSLNQLNLPDEISLMAIIRQTKLLFPQYGTLIEPNDHVLVLITNKKYLPLVESLFTSKQKG